MRIVTLLISFLLLIPGHTLAGDWESFITPKELDELRKESKALVIVDVRSVEEYESGHIPNAINIPGKSWRTLKAKPNEGNSQYLFRKESGQLDIARYEQFLGKAGISPENPVVVYGNHAGKGDGSVPAFILHWLGHTEVSFLDGKGIDEWVKAGFEISTETSKRNPSKYTANVIGNYVWNLEDVLKNLSNPDTLYYDTRSPGEFEGKTLRSNKYGGRIPGAVLINYTDFLDPETKTVKPREEVQEILKSKDVTPEKQIVLYCQTATRTSLPALALKDLGYKKVSVYDASWHEYGNLETTPIEGKTSVAK